MGTGRPFGSVVCAGCGAELPGAPKFCPECGTPVSPGAERETRRTVTLLFTDVAGSTSMGEQLDPEAYRGVMGRYFAVARAAVERHGGTVEKFVGDAVLAVFGIPEVHEDDALRAVRAAHELNDALTELSEQLLDELGVRLVIRTGLNTGAVVTGSARAGGSFATGDAVNTAARLEQAAGDGEILLGETTYALVRDAVEVEAAAAVRAKGKSGPVRAYRLLRVLDTAHGRRRRVDVPLVGRETETRALDDALTRTTDSGRSHLVTVLGPAGIGKSRLVSEFLLRVGDRALVAHGRCVPYGQGITYWPLVQAVRGALRLAGTESEELTRHSLEQALGAAPDRDRVVEVLLPLLGKTGVPGSNEQTVWSVCRLLEELASRHPLVLSVEDLHWAEPTLLDLLERVRAEISDLPLLLVCQARPELLEQHPGWGTGAMDSVTLGLDALSPGETRASVEGLLGGDPPDGMADAVAARSGGNPLFIEEIVEHLIESGVLEEQTSGGWLMLGSAAEVRLPATVSALLAARLDGLPSSERDLLERVSVIGLDFTTVDAELVVEPVARPGVAALLLGLMRRDLVRRVRPSEGRTWAFKHAMVRDAAYDGLAKTLRAELHERFADGLTASDVREGGGELVGFLAHHLEQAALYRRELGARGPRVEALAERAVEALLVAAQQARDRDLPEDHLRYLQRAMRLSPAASATRRRILARLSDHYLGTLQEHHLVEMLDAFAAELDDTSDELDHAYLRMMRLVHELITGSAIDPAEVTGSAQEYLSLAREAADPASVVRGLGVLSLCSGMLGLWHDAAAVSEEIVRIGSPADARGVRAAYGQALFVGDGTLRQVREVVIQEREISGRSDFQEWNEQLTDALIAAADRSPGARSSLAALAARAEELLVGGTVAEPNIRLIDGFSMARDLDAAIAHCQRVADAFRSSGALGVASTSILQQSMLMLERGDAAATVLPLVEEAASYTSPYDATSNAFLAACRAILAIRAGDLDRGSDLADEALATVDRTQVVWQQADLRRWLSAVPRATGDRDRERRMLVEAEGRYRRKEIRSYDAEIRARLAELGGDGA